MDYVQYLVDNNRYYPKIAPAVTNVAWVGISKQARSVSRRLFFWKQASRELKDAATKFIALDEYLDHLRHR